MLFNSYVFIFLFLPLALAGYYLLNYLKKYRAAGVFLTGMSLWFYGHFNKSYLFIICGSIAANYLLSVLINRGGGMEQKENQENYTCIWDTCKYSSYILF